MKFLEINERIKNAEIITIFRHVGPDGDAYGSQKGLKYLIERNYPGKKVYCLGEKSSYWTKLLGDIDEVEDSIIANSLAIILDTPTTGRIDDVRALNAKEIIKIDHHIFVEEFADLELVDTSFSSVCEMVTTLAMKNNWACCEKAATSLYTGLTTDAGRFLYSYTPNLFACASFLIANGADVDTIYPHIYEKSEDSVKFNGFCQANFKKTSFGVAYNKLTPEVLAGFGIPAHQGSGMVNALANIKDIDIWAHFSETEEGTIRAELRSKGIPVNFIANEFGGGGHRQASGASLLNWDEVDIMLAKLDRAVFESKPYYQQLELALQTAKEASALVMDIYNNQNLDIEIKKDESPVTQADKLADKFIREKLLSAYPDYGCLSEESKDDLSRLDKEYVWVVDPIDGTKDFISHDDEFAINIALIRDHKVVVGVIAVPAKNTYYFATFGGGAFKEEDGQISRIRVSRNTTDLVALTSHFHTSKEEEKVLKQFESLISEVKGVGSAYKGGLIAEGKAHLNMKYSDKTNEWDIAPGVIIVTEAGGVFVDAYGKEITFNRPEVRNLDGYVTMNKLNKEFLK